MRTKYKGKVKLKAAAAPADSRHPEAVPEAEPVKDKRKLRTSDKRKLHTFGGRSAAGFADIPPL